MAIQTRYAGDAQGVNNVDAKTDGTLGTIIATGLTKNPTALKISGFGTFSAAESATGGAVETILRSIAQDSTITCYQVNSGSLSVLLEATGAGAANSGYGYNTTTLAQIGTALQTRIQAIVGAYGAGNISAASGNVWANAATVVSSVGFKLALS